MRRALQIPHSARRATWFWLVLACLGSVAASPVSARDDVVLEQLLRDCRDYRVRVRAAEALGRAQNTSSLGALAAALVDKRPEVRLAAAAALGQLGAAAALPALRASLRDPSPAVAKRARQSIVEIEFAERRRGNVPRSQQPVRYSVYVGELRDRSSAQEKGMLPILANSLDQQLRIVDGAQLLDAESKWPGDAESGTAERPAAVKTAVKAAVNIPVYRVDGSITDTDRALLEDKVTAHASVALLLTDDSNQTLRIVFKGSSTTIEDLDRHAGDQPERVARLAMERAVRAALRNASSAMNETLASRR